MWRVAMHMRHAESSKIELSGNQKCLLTTLDFIIYRRNGEPSLKKCDGTEIFKATIYLDPRSGDK